MDKESYISGFVDGEGCFCVSFQPSTRHRLGWEVRPSFSVSQNAERSQVLNLIRDEWKCGHIRPDRSDNTLKYEVRNIHELVRIVLPHFRKFPLLSAKQNDLIRFDEIYHRIALGEHLLLSGFVDIVQIAMKMNPTGKRKYSGSEILNSLRSDEGIVCATGNSGIT